MERIYIFFICFCKVITSTVICDGDKRCNFCDYCGKDTKNYDSCFYYNIFCYDSSSINLFYNYYKYSLFYKKEYIQYYEKDNDIISFCGQTEYSLDNQEENFTLCDSCEKTFPKNKNMHCHYIITKSEESISVEIQFKTKNENVNEDRHLNVTISNLIKYDSKDEEEINIYSNSKIHRSPITYMFTDISKIEIFIDFLESDYNQPEEIFQIKFYINKKDKTDSNKDKEDLNNDEEDSSKDKKDSSNKETILGSAGGIIGLLILGLLICYCCRKKEDDDKEEDSCCC